MTTKNKKDPEVHYKSIMVGPIQYSDGRTLVGITVLNGGAMLMIPIQVDCAMVLFEQLEVILDGLGAFKADEEPGDESCKLH